MEAVRRDAARREWDKRCWAGEGDVATAAASSRRTATPQEIAADDVLPEERLSAMIARIAPHPAAAAGLVRDWGQERGRTGVEPGRIEALSEDLGRPVRLTRARRSDVETPASLAEVCGGGLLALPLLPDVSGRTLVLLSTKDAYWRCSGASDVELLHGVGRRRTRLRPGSEGNFPRFKTEQRDDRGPHPRRR